MDKKILISACLIGENVKYDGGNNALHVKILEAWKEQGILVPLCPEVLGGLNVPRPPCEVIEGTDSVICKTGEDVSAAFAKGARESLRMAREEGACMAILKARSPSCGKDVIYDGTFTHTPVNDSGITCKLLQESGITVFSEEELVLAEAFWRQKG
ncbi:DUF523 domain-containing protein [Sulfurospirillum diekertiae]|uniref:DUF523 domain-containing protein n=1 Tax=Sulfurospirillum diekertiae TaxID=1854492 RepID=A0A6G9VRF3_9BACT|nr:DUF523 domain-containing protein [Sulfurospirillum diekertiae]QIR75532.1 DUF523 domain-containing protein [Sulfurospirillum diekertiae]QIR78182.1 DUF523 domain-containing protein [Sulfurospirillum diekertiae]